MTLRSLYLFFRSYFNYQTTGNAAYARSISEAMGVIREAMLQKSMSPIQKYLHRAYSMSIAKDMLHRLVYLAMKYYQDPFNEIQYFRTTVHIDKSFISSRHRYINIPIEGGLDSKNNKLIILTFSQPVNIYGEVSVIKGLLQGFPAAGDMITDIKTIAYWDLSKGRVTEMNYLPIQPVSRKSLIEAANKI